MIARSSTLAALVAATTTALAGCARSPPPTWSVAGGDPARGRAVIERTGCGGCHVGPGIRNARGHGGPPLTACGDRVNVAGLLPNTPENLVHWIRAPQSVLPGNAMPDPGLDERDARDVAAYLYSLRGD